MSRGVKISLTKSPWVLWHVDPLLGNASVNKLARIRRQKLDNFLFYATTL
jgi:hypothetical protein